MGRRWITIVSYYIFLLAIVGILVSHDIVWLYVFVFITGTTFPGRAIVGMSWLLEFNKKSKRQLVMFIKLISYPILIIIYTLVF